MRETSTPSMTFWRSRRRGPRSRRHWRDGTGVEGIEPAQGVGRAVGGSRPFVVAGFLRSAGWGFLMFGFGIIGGALIAVLSSLLFYAALAWIILSVMAWLVRLKHPN